MQYLFVKQSKNTYNKKKYHHENNYSSLIKHSQKSP